MEREKIINGLKNCAVYGGCVNCSYCKTVNGKIDTECKAKMCRDALELIDYYEQKIFELENRLKECENGYEGSLHLDRCKLHDAEEKIKELTEENEKLKKAKYIFSTVDYCADDLAKALEDNKRLTEEKARLMCQVNRLKKYDKERDIALHARLISETKADTVRKMQAMAHEKAWNFGLKDAPIWIVDLCSIDHIEKEMLEDKK